MYRFGALRPINATCCRGLESLTQLDQGFPARQIEWFSSRDSKNVRARVQRDGESATREGVNRHGQKPEVRNGERAGARGALAAGHGRFQGNEQRSLRRGDMWPAVVLPASIRVAAGGDHEGAEFRERS